ncbi:hypothetical protein CLV84_1260 [Neolewinella xylanilytica]|uniref:Outer membrane protein with beta-barrel domain n=1 Tax=Neolewinella xylanilytica TaxID=1514080 RepID=A0A2S6I9X0_9BACT|nr:hypothetical protein [Neolewinella xylanilytica]PPK88295.1 hypothetical protein CLV84_1260 [Neolewinella xylanilytica]
MPNQYLNWSIIFSALFFLFSPISTVTAQQRLDLGVVGGPEVNFVGSEPRQSELSRIQTIGEAGTAVGYFLGAYLEYEVLGGLYVRGGLNYSRKRYSYAVSRGLPERGDVSYGQNRIVYTAIEVPLAILYRFPYLPNNDRFLVGLGGVADRWVGDPQVKTDFLPGSADRSYIREAHRSVNFFIGYDHYLSDRFVIGIEPYLSYSPTEFLFETETISANRVQGGIAVRIRFDN